MVDWKVKKKNVMKLSYACEETGMASLCVTLNSGFLEGKTLW